MTLEYDPDDLNVFDNFLSDIDWERVKVAFLDPDKPIQFHVKWMLAEIIIADKDSRQSNLQLTNTSFIDLHFPKKDPGIVDPISFKYLTPILAKIRPYKLWRIKSNITFLNTTALDSLNERYWHIDVDNAIIHKGMTAIYYMTTCDGGTAFLANDHREAFTIDSVANRLVVFPNHWKHSVVKQTDATYRCVVNLNWVDKVKEQRYLND